MNRIGLLMMAFLICPSNATAADRCLGDGRDILMQGYTWLSSQESKHWNTLSGKIPAMRELGVTMLWLPPSADSVDSQGYLPRDWYNQNNAYGTETDLRLLIAKLRAAGIRPVADVVVNHRCGLTSVFDFQRPPWPDACAAIVKEDNRCNKGDADTGESYEPAPDINHKNRQVQKDVEAYLKWLMQEIGYEGFRWDFCKGFDPRYVRQYLAASQPYFSVAEYWVENKDDLKDWLKKEGGTTTAFDFPLKYVLNRALRSGDYSSLGDKGRLNGFAGLDPAHAVTFLENHDTEDCRGDSYNTFPAGKELEGYAILLTHPGIPMIFYGHYFGADEGQRKAIKSLADIRKRLRIQAKSKLKIHKAKKGLYAAEIDGRVALRCGEEKWEPKGDGWTEAAKGGNWMIWEKKPEPAKGKKDSAQ